MKNMKHSIRLSFIVLITGLFLSSCLKTNSPTQQTVLRVGLVGAVGGFNDSGFNQNILNGFKQAAYTFPMMCQARESPTVNDISANINYYLANSFEMIVTASYDASQPTIAAATAHPGTDFAILDFSASPIPSNLLCAFFDVDQSSFPCGFLAAFWAYKQNPVSPVAGWVGGPDIPNIRQFSVSYANGIKYFNTLYKKNVITLGCFASSFTDSLQGARLADSLLKQNASVIFAFAYKTGNGALYKVKEAGKWAIGVDVDQYYSTPDLGPVLLTSCMKELGIMTYTILGNYYNKVFPGGSVIHGNLSNKGVGMAPFHNYDLQIPDSIKTAITTIKEGIINGTIKTGWPQ